MGHKRFSLEGGEALIPVLDRLITEAINVGATEVVMGMSHRGRLNVLANILAKPLEKIFGEFEGNLDPESREGTGDVKYHLGAVGSFTAPDGRQARITLASNPSHLEAADPVVEGMARALQDQLGDSSRIRAVPILVHGDAAFAGQGVVAETLNMSALQGYRTGGTVHVVVNNGIGFTTAPADARSSVYATDVAKMVQAPIFHVNGEDPEACVIVATLAMAFRYAFRKDVVIDLVCYRKWGHNEGDEPAFTQPLMYARIRDRRSVRKLYTEKLVNRGELTLPEAEAVLDDFQKRLEGAFAATDHSQPPAAEAPHGAPAPAAPLPMPPPLDTARLQDLLDRLCTMPEGFHLHPKLARLMEQRRGMLAADAVDWGAAEALAFGSLVADGITVRLSGQDSRRGTFSHRHAVLVDQQTGAPLVPLQALATDGAQFQVFDSSLSEYAVLGFEYGYSVQRPQVLVLWEAQFGDFVERRPDHHRPVPGRRGREVGAALAPGDAAPPRLRGAGPRALLGAARALPAAPRRRQPARPDAIDGGAVLPPPARPAPHRARRAGRGDDPQEPAAPGGRQEPRRRPRRRLPRRAARPGAPRRRPAASSCAAARSSTTSWTAARNTDPAATSCASSNSRRSPPPRSPRRWPPCPRYRSWSGCRRSRPTWAPPPSCSRTSRSWPDPDRSASPAARPPAAPPPAPPTATTPSRPRSSRLPSAIPVIGDRWSVIRGLSTRYHTHPTISGRPRGGTEARTLHGKLERGTLLGGPRPCLGVEAHRCLGLGPSTGTGRDSKNLLARAPYATVRTAGRASEPPEREASWIEKNS